MNNRTQMIRDESCVFGTWLTTGSTVVTELASKSRFHWLLFDMEHGNFYDSNLLINFQAVRNENIAIIVRVPSADSALIGKVLDLGADGIMIPHVNTAEQAKECAAAMYYPPTGTRGFSSSVRAFGYGSTPPESTKPLPIVQIEDQKGVENAHAIAGVEAVDVLFVGPADLKLSLSIESTIEYQKALDLVLEASMLHKKKAGILTRDYTELPRHLEKGFSFIGINSDTAILRQGYSAIMHLLNR